MRYCEVMPVVLSLQESIDTCKEAGAAVCRYLLLSLSEGCEPANQLYYVDMGQLPRSSKTGALDFTLYDRRRAEPRPQAQSGLSATHLP